MKMLHRRLVHIDETVISNFWAVNCIKMRLAAGFRPDLLGSSYGAPPNPLTVITGRGKQKERVGNREGGNRVGDGNGLGEEGEGERRD